MCGVGTFCHEFGHVLGLPDYYNTSASSTTTLETWEVMDYGPYLNGGNTPPSYSAWDRFFLGYLIPQQINSASNITLQPLYLGTHCNSAHESNHPVRQQNFRRFDRKAHRFK